MIKKRKIAVIEWVDSKGVTSDWEFFDEIKPMEPEPIQSVGYLVATHPDYKTLAQSMGSKQMCGRLTIPAVAIKSIKYL